MEKMFLKKLPLFAHLSDAKLKTLADSSEKHAYSKGKHVFREHDPADRLYIVYEGKIKIFKLSADGKEHILQIMQKYDIIGEAPMFSGGTYPANSIALTKSTLFSISRNALLTLIKQDPSIALGMLALQAKRLREFTVKIEKLTLQKIEQRLADYFTKKIKESIDKSMVIESNDMNIQDLADYLGASRENISRIISKWIKMNIINKKRHVINILKPDSLKKIAE